MLGDNPQTREINEKHGYGLELTRWYDGFNNLWVMQQKYKMPETQIKLLMAEMYKSMLELSVYEYQYRMHTYARPDQYNFFKENLEPSVLDSKPITKKNLRAAENREKFESNAGQAWSSVYQDKITPIINTWGYLEGDQTDQTLDTFEARQQAKQ